jgi:CrcB protein
VELFPSSSQVAGPLFVRTLVVVGAGGAIGAGGRWAIGTVFASHAGSWPWSTLTVNLVGCVLIGLIAGQLWRGTLRWDFLVTGVLGGFTTMSAFAVELNEMVDADRSGLALCYAAITIGGGLLAVSIAHLAASAPDVGLPVANDART